MSDVSKNYIIKTVVGSVIFNAFINAFFAVLIFKSQDFVPLYGQQSIAFDSLFTAILLTFLTVIFVYYATRRLIKKNLLPKSTKSTRLYLSWLFDHVWVFDLIVTILMAVVVTSLVIASFTLLQVSELSYWNFVIYKAFLGGSLAAFVSWFACMAGLSGGE